MLQWKHYRGYLKNTSGDNPSACSLSVSVRFPARKVTVKRGGRTCLEGQLRLERSVDLDLMFPNSEPLLTSSAFICPFLWKNLPFTELI